LTGVPTTTGRAFLPRLFDSGATYSAVAGQMITCPFSYISAFNPCGTAPELFPYGAGLVLMDGAGKGRLAFFPRTRLLVEDLYFHIGLAVRAGIVQVSTQLRVVSQGRKRTGWVGSEDLVGILRRLDVVEVLLL
jgi:hypothetical protein